MLAILTKLLPLRDWCYIGVIIALLAAFGWYTYHERSVGAQKVVAADTRLATKQAARVAKVETNETADIQASRVQYKAAVAAPTAPAPSIVCRAAAPGRSVVPGHGRAAAGSNGASAVPAESTVPFDPAPAVINDGRDADAQIAELQAYIRACQKAGVCKVN